MNSPWKVTSQYIDDCQMFAVYRLRNTAEVDHSGNRELASDYTKNRAEAQAIADRLNAGEAAQGGIEAERL